MESVDIFYMPCVRLITKESSKAIDWVGGFHVSSCVSAKRQTPGVYR